jgi:hypothetical protein
MNNQFVIGVEFRTNPVIIITGNGAYANGIAADLYYDSHGKVGLFRNISSLHFPHQFSDNTKRREKGFKSNMPPFILECQLILKAAERGEVEHACLPDYFPFLLGHQLIDTSHTRFLNDSRKLNNIWN